MAFTNDQELYSTVSKNIKFYRKKAGLTQIQLAEEAQCSLSYIAKIEAPGCDKSISLSTLNQIANVLNVNITVFLEATKHV